MTGVQTCALPILFVATPTNQVIAIEAKTGKILWRFRRPAPEGSLVPHQTTRGLALYGDKVFFAVGEAVLVAIDVKTGKEVWATKVEENKNGYYITMAPLVADGKVFVGASGGERGIRGFVAAFDPETGKELWRSFTVPAPGDPGSETWPKGDQWKTGGGPMWITGTYQAGLLGDRQWRPVDGRSAPRRQSLHQLRSEERRVGKECRL